MKGYEMLCVIVLGLFSLLNDVTLTIQIMTLKIVVNIINLSGLEIATDTVAFAT